MTFILVFLCIAVLIILISWVKLNAFLSFLLVSIMAGFLFGLPLTAIIPSIEKGIGSMMGSLIIIITLGAMFGKIIAESGAVEQIASQLIKYFGTKYVHWALMITGFVMGISLFYGVGFVLVVPLIFSVTYQYKLPAVATGLPMLAALSVTHGFLPPHPAPTALVHALQGSITTTLLYGCILAVPALLLAGPFFCRYLRKIPSSPLESFIPKPIGAGKMPGKFNSIITALLPVLMLMAGAWLKWKFPEAAWTQFISNASLVMIFCILVATLSLGYFQGISMRKVGAFYGAAIKDIAIILLVIAGAGALNQVLADSGVSADIAASIHHWPIHPLVLGWLMAAIIRLAVGSATIAGLTAAGFMAPLTLHSDIDPNLMVLSIGAGSLFFSHVNDSGFWLFKEYFNLSMKDTFKSWSVMETIVSVTGLLGVFILHLIVK
jgi:Gnt-I system high-affinity gluconate transporter